METALTPHHYYQTLLNTDQLEKDPQQAQIVDQLENIHKQLTEQYESRSWLKSVFQTKKTIPGIYLWGEVGVGKTFLLELLYQTLPVPKLRQHYHVFMQDVQQRLHEIQGEKDPLTIVAKEYAEKYSVFFLDEFIVSDITNAMILSGLLEAIFKAGICLITTSNIKPDDLYQYGFQREKFLPAIEQIKNNTAVVNLDTATDYRRSENHTHEGYLTPITPLTQQLLKEQFSKLTGNAEPIYEPSILCGRTVPIIMSTDRVAWYDFHVLCTPPRSQLDYIELSHRIRHLILSNIPALDETQTNQVSLLTKLIDVLYDEGIQLTASGAVPIDELYPSGNLAFAFNRTKSRIIEMTSKK